MGFRVSWIAAQQPVSSVLDALEVVRTGETGEYFDFDLSVGELPNGWVVVWSNDQAFFDAPRSEELSAHFPLISCWVNETVMHSRVTYLDDGRPIWKAWHEGDEVQTHIAGEGNLPANFAELVAAAQSHQAADPEVDYLFEVPLQLAEQLCGFKHDTFMEDVRFEEIRLAGVGQKGVTTMPGGFWSKLLGGGRR